MADVKDAIRCSNPKCGKVIGSGTVNDGRISIKCKCGTTTTIEAAIPKPPGNYVHNRPYQNRMDLEQK